jgi:hypothetical protein
MCRLFLMQPATDEPIRPALAATNPVVLIKFIRFIDKPFCWFALKIFKIGERQKIEV